MSCRLPGTYPFVRVADYSDGGATALSRELTGFASATRLCGVGEESSRGPDEQAEKTTPSLQHLIA
jgi:hypothetical protein